MTCKCDMRTKLVGDGCSECNPELYKEMLMDEVKELQQENDELAIAVRGYEEECKALKAYVERLREAYYENKWIDDRDYAVLGVLKETPAQSLERSEKEGKASLNHIKAQIAERRCSELAAQVEEEAVNLCAVLLEDCYPEEAEWLINNYQYKYSNQPETETKAVNVGTIGYVDLEDGE